jgi:pimeloyl-ACP methyl ester carboxylesterase
MNDKQRRLIDYFSKLPEPAPPRSAVSSESIEESFFESLPPPPAPSTPSAESVKTMLETATAPGDQPVTEREVEVAVSATEKALNDEEMSFEEQDILEALVLPGKRPVLDIVNGDFSTPPAGWEWLADYGQLIRAVLPSVGRIDIPELSTAPYGGTGFFVGDGLLMTNRHVARIFVQGVGAGPKYLTFLADRTAFFDSQYEVGDDPGPGSPSERFQVIEAKLVHPHWDTAILKVKPVDGTQLPPPLKLARQMPTGFGSGSMINVAVIGYPMLDSRNNIPEQMNIFRSIFGRKRLMPGYMTGFGDVKTKWDAMLHATIHDASTLGGNSGSAVIDLTTGLVLSLHFGGVYLKANYGVPTWELALDSKVTDLGVNFTDFPGVTVATGSGTPPIWTKAWDTVTPLVGEENILAAPAPAPVSGAAPAETLPVAPDWFERISDVELLEAMRRDRVQTERLIRETLLPKEADDLIGDLERGLQPVTATTTEEGIFDFLLGGDKVDPSLPEIIFLHGIMGGHLAAYGGFGGRIWLSPLAFVAGGVAARLTLGSDGLQDLTPDQILYPDGPIRLVYEKPARKWRMQGFVVHEFSFDWRKPVTNAADRLHLFIESLRLERPAKKFALVGHSMGGCVSAVYAASHPEWSSRISQAIFMGAPLRGSFAPIEAFLGTYSILPKAALVDFKNNLGQYVAFARSLPGLIDLLPDPETFPSAAPLYERATWPKESAPAQVWLDQSRQMKRVFATSPILETARLIVTPNVPTVGDVGVVGGKLQPGRRNLPGDGTVPTRSAAGVRVRAIYRATSDHGTLPREDAVIKAVQDLLKNGTCDLPPLTDVVINDITPIEESITEAIEEATAADLSLRMRTGIFTQRDADFFLRADDALPGPVGTLVTGGM